MAGVFVKICGITNEDDALLAIALDADALGFVFAPSVRQVDTETVRDIVRRLPREVHTVGVFRDERPERIIEIVGRTGLRRRAAARTRTGLRGRVAPRAGAVRHPGIRGGRSRARTRRRERSRHHSRRLARPRLGQGLRLAPGRRCAARQADTARGRADAPTTSARRSAWSGRGASTCRAGSKPAPVARIPPSSAGSSRRRARPRSRSSTPRSASGTATGSDPTRSTSPSTRSGE